MTQTATLNPMRASIWSHTLTQQQRIGQQKMYRNLYQRISKAAGTQSSRNRHSSCRFPEEALSRTTGQIAFQNPNLAPCNLSPSNRPVVQLCDQGLSGEEDELIPAEEVLKVIRASVALIGNANYVSQLRRRTIIEALLAEKAKLAKIRKQVCRRQIAGSISWRPSRRQPPDQPSRSVVKLRQQSKSFFFF